MRTYKFEIFTTAIEKNIREGIFKPGHKLPSIRSLKAQYRTSISTIQKGFEHLSIQGLVESIPKSGYYVSSQPNPPTTEKKHKRQPLVRDPVFNHYLHLTTTLRTGLPFAEFNVAAPGDLMIPQKLLLRTMQSIIRQKGSNLLRYYPPTGSAELRNAIVSRAANYDTTIDPEELLITDGALQALYIALTSVCDAGDIVAVESPCVFSVLEVIRVLRLKIIEIPTDTTTGFDIDFLKKACKTHRIKALIVTPNFHNPTGRMLSDEQKHSLLSVAVKNNVAIIENDIYTDLHFQSPRPSTIKSFDESGLVLSYGSYAKTLAPGIRLGWLTAGKYLQRAEQIKFALGSTVTPLYQETVNQLLKSGSYDRHVRAFRLQLAKNAYSTINLLSTHFPRETAITTPYGGYNIWVRMPNGTDMDRFYQHCQTIGVRFTPGYTFSFSKHYDNHFRVVFADKLSPKKIAALTRAGRQSR